jgi:RNA polymerase sigma-70 factor (ECF subfamily)
MKEAVTVSGTSMDIPSAISRCLAGDREGFTPIIHRYQGTVYRICYQIIQNREEAKDAVSEVFFKAYSNLVRFDQARMFSAWLYRIAVNHCLSIVRRKKSESRYLKEQGKDSHLPAVGPSGTFLQEERNRSVSRFLNLIPGKFKSVLILKYYQGLTYAEISEVMNIPRNTVASYLLRGKKKLRKIMETKGVSHEML